MTGRLVNICNHIRGNNLLSESALYTKFWNGYSIAERYAFIYSNIEVPINNVSNEVQSLV